MVFRIKSDVGLNFSLSNCDLTILILFICKMEIMLFHNVVGIKQDNVCAPVFWACHNKVPQSEWLKQQKLNCFTVLEATTAISSCLPGLVFF